MVSVMLGRVAHTGLRRSGLGWAGLGCLYHKLMRTRRRSRRETARGRQVGEREAERAPEPVRPPAARSPSGIWRY